uniref:Pyridoxal phosphate homeostasis protein n=1 Tax=uncultured Armatimonadetes bacterium TaxID=157466 RepID=A0A6J4JZX3_9BACT|nr:UPF0001 protein YggS [uncultured Armatimonadetes bacterium]
MLLLAFVVVMEQAFSTVADRVAAVQERIARAEARAGRSPGTVRLVAVTKRVPAARVAEAAAAGVTEFGENYVQEARAKIPELTQYIATDINWHLIGHLQTNKAKYAVLLFPLIHTVDTYQLAQELGRQTSKRHKTQNVLIEVNLSGDPGRAGARPEESLELADRVGAVPGLELKGLMGMAPYAEGSEDARPHFRRLRALFDRLPGPNRQILSMGMSGDFEVAIEEGATLVRIGTALFGKREGG